MDSVDFKFINLISVKLDNFQEVRQGLWRFRCPICGDSEKKLSKSRGHFIDKGDNILVYCFNCGYSNNLYNFFKLLDNSIYTEFSIEKFKNKVQQKRVVSFTTPKLKQRLAGNINADKKITGLKPLESIKECLQYVQSRMIPETHWDKIYSVFSLRDYSSQFDKYKDSDYNNLHQSEAGIIIPFYTNETDFSYIQFRSITKKLFAILEVSEVQNPKIWGLNQVKNNSFCFEAPIDAMMVPNSVAIAGAGNKTALNYLKQNYDVTIVMDNDYSRNEQILKQLKQRIKEKFKVVIYDKRFKWKDVNDAIVKGKWSYATLESYLIERTFYDAAALMELSYQNR